jgi:hypothetical protein
MAQPDSPDSPDPLDWAAFLGSWGPFALAVAPYLSNRELFELATCSRKLLRLRYDLGRWAFRLDDDTYESFCAIRYSVPLCFEATGDFDFVAHLGSRLSVRMPRAHIENVDALAGVHTLHLSGCTNISDVSALGDVHKLYLVGCTGITDVSALGGVHELDLSVCTGISDVSALGGVHTLFLGGCTGIIDVSALRGVHTASLWLYWYH